MLPFVDLLRDPVAVTRDWEKSVDGMGWGEVLYGLYNRLISPGSDFFAPLGLPYLFRLGLGVFLRNDHGIWVRFEMISVLGQYK